MKNLIYTLIFFLSVIHDCYSQLYMQSGADLTIENGATLTVEGNADLVDGSIIRNAGIIYVGNTKALTSAWTDHSTISYFYGTGNFIFNSGTAQTVKSENRFGILEMNSAGLTLESNIHADKWKLTNGIIHTGVFKAIVLAAEEFSIEADITNPLFINSWINGNIRRFINPSIVNSYIFPTGNLTRANPAEMNNLNSEPLNNINYIDAFFTPKAGNDAGLNVTEQGSLYSAIHEGGIWHLIPDASPSSGKYNLKLYLNGFTDLADNQFTILKRPEGSIDASDWFVPAGSTVNPNGGDGRLVIHGYALRNELAEFSQYGIGMLLSPLPVKLTAFNADRETAKKVLVTWKTETEQNNRGFYVERKFDFETEYARLEFVPSKAIDGNSTSVINYVYPDENDYGNITYYRLLQVDTDGNSVHSAIKAVKGISSVSIGIFPNPSSGQFSILLKGISSQKEIFILDMGGKLVRKMSLQNQQHINISDLKAGTYILVIPGAFEEAGDFREKIVIIK